MYHYMLKNSGLKNDIFNSKENVWMTQIIGLFIKQSGWLKCFNITCVWASLITPIFLDFPCSSAGKESASNVGNLGSIPGLRRSPGGGKGYPLQYYGLENLNPGLYSSWGGKESDVTFTFTLPASWEICMHVMKKQSELDMEQWTGSKLGKEYDKDVYCPPAY